MANQWGVCGGLTLTMSGRDATSQTGPLHRDVGGQHDSFLTGLNSRLSALDDDDVCLHLAIHIAAAEPPGDSFRRDIGCVSEPRRVAPLDFVP